MRLPRSVEDIGEVLGKRVLVRASLNAPIQNGVVTNSLRLEGALATIEFLRARGARVIVLSHMSESEGTLEPVFHYLKKILPISFVNDVVGSVAKEASYSLKNGEVLLLQNIRSNKGEKENDMEFAKALASLADFYVADDFTVAHRTHAAVTLVPTLLPSYAGFQFLKEIQGLTPGLSPKSPSLAIIGGAKLTTKAPLLASLLTKYDQVFVGGALANDFFKAKGYEVGRSLLSGTDIAEKIFGNNKVIVPTHVVVDSPTGRREVLANAVEKDDIILDIAPSSIEALRPSIESAGTVLWNGPMGNFERGFTEGTCALAEAIAGAKGQSIVGGGDTLASIQECDLMDKFEFVSTAGGAMLDFLANGTLPGIEVLLRLPQ